MKILDLYCGAGGSAMGLYRAGFDVIGIDINPQPNYPFKFKQADALTFDLDGYDAYWASPPCQAYTKATKQWRRRGKRYPDLIKSVRERFLTLGEDVCYVIENVPNAPLENPIYLNGCVFGLLVHRLRLFECSFPVAQPVIPKAKQPIKMGRAVKRGDIIQPVGHFSGVSYAQEQMGIDWMGQKDLAQAIPPAYSEYVGGYLKSALKTTKK